jgi:hypothetical protein
MCENNLTTRSRVTTDTEEARARVTRAKTTLQHGLVSRQTQKKIRSLTALKLGRTQGRRILKRPLQLTIVRYDNLVGFTMCTYSARQLARRITIYVYSERRSINQICNAFTMYASSVRRSILSLVTNLQRTSPPYDDQHSPL